MKLSDRPMSLGELLDRTVHITVLNALPLFSISSIAVLLAVVFRILTSMEPVPPPELVPMTFLPQWSLPAWFGLFAQFGLYSLALTSLLIKLDASGRGQPMSLMEAYAAGFARWASATLGLGFSLALAYIIFLGLSLGLYSVFGMFRALSVAGSDVGPTLGVAGVLIILLLSAVAASIATRFVIAGVMCAVAIVLDGAGLIQGVLFGMRAVAWGGRQFWRTLGAGTALAAMLVLVGVIASAITALVPVGISRVVDITLESVGYLILTTLIAVFALLFYNDLQLRGVSLARPRLRFDLDPQIHAALGKDNRDR
jgi:hypothetical protein